MRPDDLIGNPGDLTPAQEAEAAEKRRHAKQPPHSQHDPAEFAQPGPIDRLPEDQTIDGERTMCGGCVGSGRIINPNSGQVERHAHCGGEGIR